MRKVVEINGHQVGEDNRCLVIAEAGCNHNQDLDIAKKLVDMASDARADLVKFQTYRAEEMYSKKTPMMKHFRDKMNVGEDATMFDLIKATELPYELLPQVVEYCREKKVPFMSTPFGLRDVDILEEFNPPAYKIASFEMTHFPLLERVGATNKPIILSTGMSTLGDIEKALNAVAKGGSDQVVLLHCVSSYPAQPKDYNLRVLQTLKAAFGCPVGLSDHTPGVEVSRLAIALGASVVEKHCTIDQGLPGPDHHFSLLPNELNELVEASYLVEEMLGSPIKRCVSAENPLKTIGRRSLCAGISLNKGDVVGPEFLVVKRPGTGIPVEFMDRLLGTTVQCDVEEDEPLRWDMFMNYPQD